jgi:diacylglycerol O-acyltransferase / wax synthase
MRLVTRFGLANRGVTLPANVVISNVPGPRVPLYFAGARMDHYIPVSTIAEGMGLNITVHSYLDRLDFGLIADRELVPDLWDLADMHIDEIGRLFEATGATWVEPQAGPSMRRGGGGVKPVARRTPTKAAAKKTAAKKVPAKQTAAKKTAAKKSAAKKTAAKKAPAKKVPAKRAAAKRSGAKKAPAKKTVAKKVPARKTAAKKTAATPAPVG